MGRNCVREYVNSDRAWVCPPGVTSIRVMSMKNFGTQLTSGACNLSVKATGDAYAWGNTTQGQSGSGVLNRSTPTLVLGSLNFIQIGSGFDANNRSFSMGLTNAADAYTWGDNSQGQLGDGTIVGKSSPVVVSGGIKWRFLAGGQVTTAAVTAAGVSQAGDGYCWGYGLDGQIGDGTIVSKSTPTLVSGGLKWRSINPATTSGMFGLASDGTAYAWGSVQGARRGDNTSTTLNASTPVAITAGYKWRYLYANGGIVYGIDESGRGFGWGGQPGGDGTSTTRSTPTLIIGGLKWRKLVGGVTGNSGASYGIDTNGNLYGWGSNVTGLVGDGTNIARSSPTIVAGNRKWIDVASGGQATVGMDIYGNVYCWGVGFQGQMGDGTLVAKSTPTLVSGTQAWRNLVTSQSNSTVIDVVPGQSYDASIFNQVVSFAGLPLASDVSTPQALILEYFV